MDDTSTSSQTLQDGRRSRLTSFVKLGAGLLVVVVVGGIVVSAISKAHEATARTECQNNLKQICLGLHYYHSTFNRFPVGTVANVDLPPEQRLSWAADLVPWVSGGVEYLIDSTKAWDDPKNCPPWACVSIDKGVIPAREGPVGDIGFFLCPANPARNSPDLPCPLHYVAIAGVGEDAAELPLSDPRVGFFGYDRIISFKDIKDGTSNTMFAAEAVDGGPFTAGGRATVRGLADGQLLLGPGGQFGGLHPDTLLMVKRQGMTNVGFVDGSIRPLSDATSPRILKAQATIAGGDSDFGGGNTTQSDAKSSGTSRR